MRCFALIVTVFFGGFSPVAVLGIAADGVSGRIDFRFSQSSNRSSSTSSISSANGAPASFSSGVLRPFVTGVTPVVGDYSAALSPLESSQRIGQQLFYQQIASLRRSQSVMKSRRLDEYLRRIERAEAKGNIRMARANYRSAIAIAPEPLRSQLLDGFRQLTTRQTARK